MGGRARAGSGSAGSFCQPACLETSEVQHAARLSEYWVLTSDLFGQKRVAMYNPWAVAGMPEVCSKS